MDAFSYRKLSNATPRAINRNKASKSILLMSSKKKKRLQEIQEQEERERQEEREKQEARKDNGKGKEPERSKEEEEAIKATIPPSSQIEGRSMYPFLLLLA